MEYQASVSPSPVGVISSLEHAARSIEDELARCRQNLERARKDHAELSALAGRMFEHEEHYRELVARQAELVTALDITKNQASEQLAAETTETEAVSTATDQKEAESPSECEDPAESPQEAPERAAALQTKPSVATVRVVPRKLARTRIAI